MRIPNLVLSVIISALITGISINFSIPFLKIYLLDNPNRRSSHNSPKPTSGGISFVFIASIFIALRGNFYPLFCLPLSLVGLIDDFKNVKKRDRYFVQATTVSILIYSSLLFKNILNHYPYYLTILPFILLILFFTGLINFINFMDGLDGLVCGSMLIIISSGSILISDSYWPLVGSLLAFIFFNWSPSKVFMGDVGSTYLGGVLVGLILLSNSWIIALKILIISAPLITDALICIPRRFLNNQSIFEAHKSHLYQRLHQAGWTHAKVSFLYIIFTGILSISIFIFNMKITFLILFGELFIAFWLDQNKAIPFNNLLRNN